MKKLVSLVLALFLLGALWACGEENAVLEKPKTYEVSAGIHTLDIRIGAADFTIRHGAGFSVESDQMNCPYCGNDMEKGLIQSPNELSWIKGDKRRLFGRSFLHEGSVVLSELSVMKGSACVAYNCPQCRKILIDYSQEGSDLNNR